jgi:hypothetical protein
MKRWWINKHSTVWREWALVEPGGKIVIYADCGQHVRSTDYGSRFKGIATLKRMGYRRIRRADLQSFTPPTLE